MGLSQRQLQRRFQLAFGGTMHHHYVAMRLAVAHKLLQQTDLPVTGIAVSAGLRSSLENFSRVYRAFFGRPPSTRPPPVHRSAGVSPADHQSASRGKT